MDRRVAEWLQSHRDEVAEAPEDNTAVDMGLLTLGEENVQHDVVVVVAVLEVD